MHFGFWNAVISAAPALAVLFLGLMIQKLWFDDWPWWAFGVLATLAICVAVLASWVQSRRIRRTTLEAQLQSEEAILRLEVLKLERRKEFFSLLNKNSWYLCIIALWIVIFVLGPLVTS